MRETEATALAAGLLLRLPGLLMFEEWVTNVVVVWLTTSNKIKTKRSQSERRKRKRRKKGNNCEQIEGQRKLQK